ncbi:MAG: hypothetical protein IK079_04250, partial [Desulfovibrio sp.]|nr:hypothetical protein [Desulfovibrio sp.]
MLVRIFYYCADQEGVATVPMLGCAENVVELCVFCSEHCALPLRKQKIANIIVLKEGENFYEKVNAYCLRSETAIGELFFFLDSRVQIHQETLFDLIVALEQDADLLGVMPLLVRPTKNGMRVACAGLALDREMYVHVLKEGASPEDVYNFSLQLPCPLALLLRGYDFCAVGGFGEGEMAMYGLFQRFFQVYPTRRFRLLSRCICVLRDPLILAELCGLWNSFALYGRLPKVFAADFHELVGWSSLRLNRWFWLTESFDQEGFPTGYDPVAVLHWLVQAQQADARRAFRLLENCPFFWPQSTDFFLARAQILSHVEYLGEQIQALKREKYRTKQLLRQVMEGWKKFGFYE